MKIGGHQTGEGAMTLWEYHNRRRLPQLALARDPRMRFESANAMACELEKAPRASAGDVSRALAGLDLPCIRRRRSLAEAVRSREVNPLHFECTRSASKE